MARAAKQALQNPMGAHGGGSELGCNPMCACKEEVVVAQQERLGGGCSQLGQNWWFLNERERERDRGWLRGREIEH